MEAQIINLLDQNTSGITTTSLNSFKLYPTPARESCTISLNESINPRFVKIYDIKGSVVYYHTIPAHINNHQLDLSNLETGMYFLKVQNSKTQQLIIQ